MSLGVFGLILFVALVASCWKNSRAAFTAVVAVMLGLIIAGSGGALSGVSTSMVDAVRSGLDSVSGALFGGV
jgi:hypothetical protein